MTIQIQYIFREQGLAMLVGVLETRTLAPEDASEAFQACSRHADFRLPQATCIHYATVMRA
jgi:hypothetical protein